MVEKGTFSPGESFDSYFWRKYNEFKGRDINKVKSFIVAILLLSGMARGEETEYLRVKGIVHLNSDISAGTLSPSKLVEMARDKGIKVVVLTDQALARGEYGIWPFRNIFHRVVERKSILKYGAGKYLGLLKDLRKTYPDMVILAGADVSPFYYWTGNPFKRDLTVHRWSEQLMVIGLNEVRDYRNLPLIANRYRREYGMGSLYQFWPISILFLGIFLFKRKSFHYIDERGKDFGPNSRLSRVMGGLIIILSLLSLANSFPFTTSLGFDQYHGDQGAKPYQRVIDYVNERGGLAFWSMPEAKLKERKGHIQFQSGPSLPNLLETENYAGFGAIYADNRTMHQPGREWDELLLAYCRGDRETPVWGIGESDYHDGPEEIDHTQTVLLLKELNREEVLAALRDGKFYAVRKSAEGELLLKKFTVMGINGGQVAHMGDELVSDGRVKIRMEGLQPGRGKMAVRLIKDGKLFRSFDSEENEFRYEVVDEVAQKGYYRLLISGSYGELISNPIFFTKR